MEKIHAARKASGMENNARFDHGNNAWGLPSKSTHTTGLAISSNKVEHNPLRLPATTPRVVNPFQNIDKNSTGKLTDAGSASTRPDKKAMFCDSNNNPNITATQPMTMVVVRETISLLRSLASPLQMTQAYKSCATAEVPARAFPL